MENYWTDREAGMKTSIRKDSTGSKTDRKTQNACQDSVIILKNWNWRVTKRNMQWNKVDVLRSF